jgi:hypothetical protein
MQDEYTIHLSAPGNPDHRQYAPIAAPMRVTASKLSEIIAICRRYIEENELGGGNWPMPTVNKNGKPFARVSYNGRCWDLSGKEIVL